MKTQRPNQEHAPRSKEREQKKMFARDVMTKNATFVAPSESVVDAAKKLSQLDVGSLPVCDGGRLVGMITDRDIVVRVLAEDQSVTEAAVGDVMSADVVSAYEDDDITTIVKRMQDHEVRRVPVVNHDNQLVGIVALADLANSNASAALKAKGLQGVS
jgi:CBS domain-containing protein